MWTEMHSIADVRARCAAVDDFNARNRYRKRGLCVLPTLYGINFGISFLCQGAALVMIYTGELLVGLRRC
jgi:xanthine dehydrogenase/oxidase